MADRTHPKRRRRMAVGATIALLALAGVVAWLVHDLTTAKGFDRLLRAEGRAGYCDALAHPDRSAGGTRRAIRGDEVLMDLPTLRTFEDDYYGPRLGDQVPPTYRHDAHLVLAAFREAITDGEEAPLDRPAVQAAMDRLEAHGDQLCRSVLPGG